MSILTQNAVGHHRGIHRVEEHTGRSSKMSSPNLKVQKKIAKKLTVGFLFNLNAWWIGVHHSKEYKCTCINIIPCCTVWIVRVGGKIPRSNK